MPKCLGPKCLDTVKIRRANEFASKAAVLMIWSFDTSSQIGIRESLPNRHSAL